MRMVVTRDSSLSLQLKLRYDIVRSNKALLDENTGIVYGRHVESCDITTDYAIIHARY